MQAKDMNEPAYVENKALCMQMLGDGWTVKFSGFFSPKPFRSNLQQARNGNFFLFALPDVSWLLSVYANTRLMLLCLRLFYMAASLIFSLA